MKRRPDKNILSGSSVLPSARQSLVRAERKCPALLGTNGAQPRKSSGKQFAPVLKEHGRWCT